MTKPIEEVVLDKQLICCDWDGTVTDIRERNFIYKIHGKQGILPLLHIDDNFIEKTLPHFEKAKENGTKIAITTNGNIAHLHLRLSAAIIKNKQTILKKSNNINDAINIIREKTFKILYPAAFNSDPNVKNPRAHKLIRQYFEAVFKANGITEENTKENVEKFIKKCERIENLFNSDNSLRLLENIEKPFPRRTEATAEQNLQQNNSNKTSIFEAPIYKKYTSPRKKSKLKLEPNNTKKNRLNFSSAKLSDASFKKLYPSDQYEIIVFGNTPNDIGLAIILSEEGYNVKAIMKETPADLEQENEEENVVMTASYDRNNHKNIDPEVTGQMEVYYIKNNHLYDLNEKSKGTTSKFLGSLFLPDTEINDVTKTKHKKNDSEVTIY